MTAIKATMKPIRSFIYDESATLTCLERCWAPRSYIVECIGKKREGAGLEGHYGRCQSLVLFQHSFAHCVHGPVISATKNANEMEIVMMSRVLGLRLNAMLMEDWASERVDAAAEDPLMLRAKGSSRVYS